MDLLYLPFCEDGNRMIYVLLFCRCVTAYSTLDLVQTPPWVNQPFSLRRYKQNTKFSIYLRTFTLILNSCAATHSSRVTLSQTWRLLSAPGMERMAHSLCSR